MSDTTRTGAPSVFLVGFMGSGKSAVGKILGLELGCGFEDTDARVEEIEGRPIEQIFRESGEGHFRETEWRVLRSLVSHERRVVATGGGLFLGVVQRRFMKASGFVVWLDAPLEVIRERIGRGEGRPLWSSDDRVQLRAFFEKRRASYALAHVRVDARSGAPAEVAARVLARLESLSH